MWRGEGERAAAAAEFTRPFYCHCFHVVWPVRNDFPRGRSGVWFESCPTFGSAAFKCTLSTCASLSLSLPARLPGGRMLGQVSYCQDCCLNTQPTPHPHPCTTHMHRHTHTHTHTKGAHTLKVVHYCACQPSVQSILPLRRRRAHTCDGRQKKKGRRGGGQQG